MKHIFVRVLVYFGVVIVAFTLLIGLLFTQFNQNNIVGTYKTQLSDLAKTISERISKADQTNDTEGYRQYMSAMEEFGSSRRTEMWVFSNPDAAKPLGDEYTNVAVEQLDLEPDMEKILSKAF